HGSTYRPLKCDIAWRPDCLSGTSCRAQSRNTSRKTDCIPETAPARRGISTNDPERRTDTVLMIKGLLGKVFGDRHAREARRLAPLVDEINAIVADLQSLSDDELRAQTEKFRGIIRERTAELEQRIVDLRQQRRTTEDTDERERVSIELREV